jgi:hypothetical protein
MYYTKPTTEDGYVEVIVSLHKDTSPIFKLRAVLDAEGFYNPVLRDYKTGIFLDGGYGATKIPNDGLKDCKELMKRYLQNNISKEEGYV